MIRSYAPGKLFIAGEYSVVETGFSAILVAIDQFIEVSLKRAKGRGTLSSYGDIPISWTREKGRLHLHIADPRLSYIISAINTVEAYAREQGKELDLYHLKVKSQLESDRGKKYGLGSSAAVTVATAKALCEHYELRVTKEELFKLAALSQLALGNNGSLGDIAASVYGGWIAYTSFDKNWALKELKNSSITEILKIPWPKLSIKSLTPPEGLELAIGWTGEPSSTFNLVEEVQRRQRENIKFYEEFLHKSKICVEEMIDAFEREDIGAIQRFIEINRQLLAKMGTVLGVVIETPRLRKLCDIARRFHGAAKPSGAGGGDCGIAIFSEDKDILHLKQEWGKSGIRYLPFSVYDYGKNEAGRSWPCDI